MYIRDCVLMYAYIQVRKKREWIYKVIESRDGGGIYFLLFFFLLSQSRVDPAASGAPYNHKLPCSDGRLYHRIVLQQGPLFLTVSDIAGYLALTSLITSFAMLKR